MKNLSLLVVLVGSFILFLIGVSIPGVGTVLHVVLVVVATILGFIFYVLTFMQVLRTPSLSPGRRIFWIVAIVCLPMIGNLIYVIMHDADVRKQVPKPGI
jgi:phospholipase D-like protein